MKKLTAIITCIIITTVMITARIDARALSAGATYSAYEIISMIFAVVGGTTIESHQGILGSGQFDANALYESMNAQKPGIGSLLSSYVNRAQYLNPGSDLLISENDYQEFLQYFHDYNVQAHTSGAINTSNYSQFKSTIDTFAGRTLPDLPNDLIARINSGEYKYIVRYKYAYNPEGYSVLFCGGINYLANPDLESGINFMYVSSNYWTANDTSVNINVWATYAKGMAVQIEGNYYEMQAITSGIGYKADSLTNGKIKNGTYDTISKSRTWDATQGKLKGPVTLTMPATSTLSDVLERENVKDITDAVNVYPTDTADDSMIYYPTQSVPDFIVPTITVNPSIAFPGVDGGISDYTIELRDYFPFCIPWDIYDMLEVFVTTPETPEFTFQFPTGVIDHQIQWTECEFDLHAWDGVAQGLRTIELIAFAVGLALMTRNILRG